MANPHNLKVGQEVWFIPNLYSNEKTPRWVTITKLGRDWAYYGPHNRRFHLETLVVDGGSFGSPGTICLDQVSWQLEEKRKKLWREIRNRLIDLPPHVTVQHLQDFLNLLKNNEQHDTNPGH